MSELVEQPDINFEDLAYEVALGYHSPEELATKYDLPLPVIQRVQQNPQFQQAVIVAEREITEAGKEFKLKARKLSSEVLGELASIALSGEADHKDRIAAIKELTRLAGYASEGDQGTGSNFNIQINMG